MQEAAIKKKYGGLLPKKQPLISKVHVHWCLSVPILLPLSHQNGSARSYFLAYYLSFYFRTMSVPTLILLIGHSERYIWKQLNALLDICVLFFLHSDIPYNSKEVKNPRDRSRLCGRSYRYSISVILWLYESFAAF